MAKPQLENGYTKIANELLEHLSRIHLSSNQWQVLLCIIRRTYGFNKKVDYIANSQICESTGLCKAVVSRTLRSLSDIKVINRKGKEIGLQKDWEQWKLAEQSTIDTKLAEQSTGEKLAISSSELAISSSELAEQSTKVSSPAVTQKKKETIQKKLYKRKRVYGEFNNVLLTDEEYQKLINRFGEQGTKERIENLSEGIASKGYKYNIHYATILAWKRKEDRDATHRGDTPKAPTDPRYRGRPPESYAEERDELERLHREAQGGIPDPRGEDEVV